MCPLNYASNLARILRIKTDEHGKYNFQVNIRTLLERIELKSGRGVAAMQVGMPRTPILINRAQGT